MTDQKKDEHSLPEFFVVTGNCLGHATYRGFASLSYLSDISRADVFDQENNKLGTQRNLTPSHARKAYQYVTMRENAFYPEVVLNIRDKSYITFVELEKNEDCTFGILRFKKDPRKDRKIVISRLVSTEATHRRTISAPRFLITFCGATTLPFDFDIFSPLASTVKPWVNTPL